MRPSIPSPTAAPASCEPSTRPRTALVLALLLCITGWSAPLAGQTGEDGPGELPTIGDYTEDMEAHPGFFPLYWDAARGRLLLEVPRLDEPFLYLTSLATGLGSNALGLDRGEIQDEHLAHFERVGSRVLLVLDNTRFRAETDPTAALERSVEESFPTSVIGGFEAVAEEGGRVLVDATGFFTRDAVGIAVALDNSDQGSFRLDGDRSAIYLPRTRAFPENTEVEATLTFASDRPGGEIRRHTPDGRALTLRQHHSLVQLPEPGYEPRRFDPRIGIFGTYYYDFGRGFDRDYQAGLARRHRLVKADPGAELSEPVQPIVYYLDPAVPEPYRAAFKLGGEWWNRVFEAAGFRNAFRVEDMPPDMDPMDARYHVIQWVHRTEAGSSIGPSFVDPRTGEIIKAAVRMDSYRSLANYNTYAGAVGVDGDWYAGSPPGVDAEEFVMMRRRQHSAHEIGHTLGLAHNFIAVSDGHASVMDYPEPVMRLVDGRLDLSGAYRAGPGGYDSLAIRYAYAPVPEGRSQAEFLGELLREAEREGWRFITNPDAGSDNSYPDATWWINGSDVLDELARVMEVRRFMLDTFDERAIEPGEPMHKLRQRFAPVYFHHRSTYEAAIKTIGGMEYRYGVRGDSTPVTRVLPAREVDRALDLLMAALDPAELAIPERVLTLLAPESFGWIGGRTEWEGRTGPAFDQIEAARTLASDIVGGILTPQRTARVVAFHARDATLPTLESVVERLVDQAWRTPAATSAGGVDLLPATAAVLRHMVQQVVVDELIELAADDDASPESRAAAEWGLQQARQRAETALAAVPAGGTRATSGIDPAAVGAHASHLLRAIDRFTNRHWATTERTDPLSGPGWARDQPPEPR